MQCNAMQTVLGEVDGFLPDFLSHVLLILSKLDGLKTLPGFPGYFYFAQEILYQPCRLFLKTIFPFLHKSH